MHECQGGVEKTLGSDGEEAERGGLLRYHNAMSLTLELTPEQERRLNTEAAQRGMEASAYALALLTDAGADPRIHWDAQGVAWIIGTGTKVVEVVRNYLGGMSAEEIAAEFPHLSPASVHAALRCY